jgi:hypothetical protein
MPASDFILDCIAYCPPLRIDSAALFIAARCFAITCCTARWNAAFATRTSAPESDCGDRATDAPETV